MKDDYLKDRDVQLEKLKLIYNSLVFSNLGQFFAAIVLIYVLKDVIAHSTLTYWFLGLCFSVLFGLVINYRYQNTSNKSSIIIANWGNTYLIAVFFSGVTWGSAGVVLYPSESIVYQSILELTIAGIIAASIGTNSSNIRASFGFISLTLIPIAVVNYFSTQVNAQSLTLLILIYYVISLISSYKFNQNLNENLSLKYIAKSKDFKLQESEEKYRLLYEKSEDPMILVSDYKIAMANKAAINILGFNSLSDLIEMPFINIFPDVQLDGTPSPVKIKLIMSELKKTGFYRCEWTGLNTKGKYLPLDSMMTIVPYEGKLAVYCIFRDISENKRIQKELLVAQQKSEDANLAKSKFLANMSHEIRTPMNGVIGITDLMLMNPLSKQQLVRANAIKNSADSMLTILNDILDFSKIEAGKLGIKLTNFNLFDLLNDFSSMVKSRMENKSLTFSTNMEQDLHPFYSGDPGRIRQILNNLIDNAYKFTHLGKITLTCKNIEETENYSIIRFNIIDTGIGIDLKQQETLFHRFTQADETTTRKYGGSGLGLSICKQLSELMGGEIGFSSKLEKGSDFWFTIKLQKRHSSEETTPNRKNQVPNTIKQFNATALVVDDNSTNQMVAEGMLESLGLTVTIVEDGQLAINALQKNEFNVVFMDCHMPILDGYEATKIIRNQSQKIINPETIIIAMTASAMLGDKEKCIASGMNDYMAKPIDLLVLQQKLELWLPNDKQTSSVELTGKKIINPSDIAQVDSNEIIFDYEALFNRLSGNQELIKTISSKFISSIELHIKNLDIEIDNKNLTKIVSLAHKLKGACANLGCMQLTELAAIIETAGKGSNMKVIVETAKNLLPCYLKSVKAIHKRIL